MNSFENKLKIISFQTERSKSNNSFYPPTNGTLPLAISGEPKVSARATHLLRNTDLASKVVKIFTYQNGCAWGCFGCPCSGIRGFVLSAVFFQFVVIATVKLVDFVGLKKNQNLKVTTSYIRNQTLKKCRIKSNWFLNSIYKLFSSVESRHYLLYKTSFGEKHLIEGVF